MKNQDEQLSHWLNFALGAVSSDKRTKKEIQLIYYFDQLRKNWSAILNDRKVTFNFEIKDEEIKIYAYGLDLDSIFNNLIANSLDAFMREGFTSKRVINIIGRLSNDSTIELIYFDSGPGLLEEIDDPDIIFEELFTTKTVNGEKVGVGLGMSIVKSIVEENNGTIEIISREPFKLKINIFKLNN
jgi:signal transduction histidine kinase